jgi:hypothetical protein
MTQQLPPNFLVCMTMEIPVFQNSGSSFRCLPLFRGLAFSRGLMDSDVSSKGDEAKEVCAEDVEATPAA